MKHGVNGTSLAGLVRSLLWLCVLSALFVCDARAATLQWEILPDRERATVTLNKEEGFAGQVRRVDRHGLLLDLGVPPLGMKEEESPEGARIFYKGVPRGRAFAFFTKTPAFGYVVTRPDRNIIIIDVFPDPLGARWKPSDGDQGGMPSAPTRQATAPQAAPESAPAAQTRPEPASEESPASLTPKAVMPSAAAAAAVPAAPGPQPSDQALPPAQPVTPPAQQQTGEGVPSRSGGVTIGAIARNLTNTDPPKPQMPMPVLPQPRTVPAAQETRGAAAAPARTERPVATQPQIAPAPSAQSRPVAQTASSAAAQAPAQALPATQTSPLAQASSKPAEQPAVPRGPAFDYRFRINPGGPNDWKDMQAEAATSSSAKAGISAANATSAAGPSAAASGQIGSARQRISNETSAAIAAAAQRPANATRGAGNGTQQVVYVDAQGKPVEAPADPAQAIAEIRRDIAAAKYNDALEKSRKLLTNPHLTRDQTEEARHLTAEMLFTANKDNLSAHYDEIMSATISAMNYNQQSPRNAGAYLRLGYLNLKTGNIAEAEAYFNMLRRQFPLDTNIPLTYYYWGDYFYGRNEMQKAADQFQYVIQHFPESEYVREATLGLARCYTALGYYPQAMQVVEYIDSRWPRFYLDHPPILEMMGDVAFREGNFDYALNKYWTLYNLMPDGPNADVVLTRIGDVYVRKKQPAAAREVYAEAERRFPKKDGGLVAMMRLAESSINDRPEISEMFSIFKGPASLRPAEVYAKIIKDFPDSQLVPLAQLKLAMWYLWNKRYEDALQQCADLVQRFPKHELAPKAEEVALKTFAILAAESISQNRPAQVAALWNKFPIIQKQQEALDPASRVALAAGQWKDGDAGAALNTVEPFFLGAKIQTYSEQALRLALTIDLENDQWKHIEHIAERVELWELTDGAARQLKYSLALAKENLNKSAEAAPIWKELSEKGKLSASEQAYVEYFLARDAEGKNELHDAYLMGRSSLNRFLELARVNPGQADTGKIIGLLASLMDISEKAGRLTEALEYAQQYMNQLKPEDSQRQGLLFRMAQIYQKQGNTPEWRKTLTELAEKYPGSVYGRTAASTLRGAKLTEDAAKFSPDGQL